MEERICPNNWQNCEDCMKLRDCRAGLYHGEPEAIIEIAATVEKQMDKEVVATVENIKRGTWAKRFAEMSEEERWQDMRKYPIPNLHTVEPYKAMAGAIVPGGGGSNRVKKSKKGNKPTVYVWGETL